MLESHDPDAIFLDVWLGTESGFELLSWIEDTRAHLADRVTFVTGELADPLGQIARAPRSDRRLGRNGRV